MTENYSDDGYDGCGILKISPCWHIRMMRYMDCQYWPAGSSEEGDEDHPCNGAHLIRFALSYFDLMILPLKFHVKKLLLFMVFAIHLIIITIIYPTQKNKIILLIFNLYRPSTIPHERLLIPIRYLVFMFSLSWSTGFFQHPAHRKVDKVLWDMDQDVVWVKHAWNEMHIQRL